MQVRSSESLEVRSGLKPWMVTGWVVARETRRGKEGSEGATERWRVSERIEMERLRGEEETEILKHAHVCTRIFRCMCIVRESGDGGKEMGRRQREREKESG